MSKLSDQNKFAQIFSGLAAENPLNAKEEPPDAYGPCWCQSGRKWKFCYKSRRAEAPVSFGQMISMTQKAQSQWVEESHVCLYPMASAESCSPQVINSHTVQRNGGLSSIAENNHVLSTKKGFLNIEKNDGEIVPGRIGIKDASTFPGFCNKHDTSMFAPVERGGGELNKESAFLLSFRALAYEYVMKQYNVVNYHVNRDIVDRGKPFVLQVATQNWLHSKAMGDKMAIADIDRWRSSYNEAYKSRNYSSFNAYIVVFDSILPFVGAGAFIPEFDFNGNKLQNLGLGAGLEHLALNVTVFNGLTIAVFGWWPELTGGAGRFVQSFSILPDIQKPAALATCIFEHLENVYYRQSWWEKMSDVEKRTLDELIRGGILGRSSESLRIRNLPIATTVTNVLDFRRI